MLSSPVLSRNLRARGRAISRPASEFDRLITLFAAGGLVSAWAAGVILFETSTEVLAGEGRLMVVPTKPAIYYAAHAAAILCVMAAGVLALAAGRLKAVGSGTRAAFVVLFATAAIWAAAAYSSEELMSTKVFGASGPFVWFTVLFVLAGADGRVWPALDKVLRALCWLSTLLAVRTVLTSRYAFYLGASKYVHYTALLLWLGGWTMLTATRLKGWRLLARTVPYYVLLIVAVCSRSRSFILLSILLGLVFVVLRARERGSSFQAVRTALAACIVTALAVGVMYWTVPQTIERAVDGTVSRLGEDTRSGQYKAFFDSVPISDLILGRGPNGTWYWSGFGEFQFFDNGYLWTLFVGGVPTLVSYSIIVLAPAVRLMRKTPRGRDGAAVAMVLFWALALSGLSVFILPGVGLTSYMNSLWAGRCHLILARRRTRKNALLSRVPGQACGQHKYVTARTGRYS